MPKRYLWRTPEGKPYKGIDGRNSPDLLFSEVERISDVNPDGSIGIKDFLYLPLQTAIRTRIAIVGPDNEEMNDVDAHGIFDAAQRAARLNPRAGESLVSAVQRHGDELASAYYRKPKLNYFLVGSISLLSLPSRVIRVRGCEIKAISKSTQWFKMPGVLSDAILKGVVVDHKDYLKIRVRVQARTIHEAADEAAGALAITRGVWNFFATFGNVTVSFGNLGARAIGVVRPGPTYTLHTANGDIVADVYWCQPEYIDVKQGFITAEHAKSLEKKRQWAMKKIRRLPYRKELESILARYAVALDQTNMSVAFLHLWAILEKLTSTVGGNYDETVRRCAWIHKDAAAASQLLGSLRLLRNQFVHTGKIGMDRDTFAELVKSFVDTLIISLIKNVFRVSSIEEFGQVLSLGTDTSAMKRQRALLGRAIRFRTR